MKIIAKKGTAFEQTVRVMCEKMTEGIIGARDMVEKAVGIRPKDTYHIFHWGTISKLTPEFVLLYPAGARHTKRPVYACLFQQHSRGFRQTKDCQGSV